MDPFHERLAQVGLAALGRYGFALAGGYAVQAHGLLERPSEDVDMFTTLAAERTFPEAVRAAVKAYADADLSRIRRGSFVAPPPKSFSPLRYKMMKVRIPSAGSGPSSFCSGGRI